MGSRKVRCWKNIVEDPCPDFTIKGPPWPREYRCPSCGVKYDYEFSCKVCGKNDIRREAVVCPECGTPRVPSRGFLGEVATTIMALAVLAVVTLVLGAFIEVCY